jgi:RNA binding exosome subunit
MATNIQMGIAYAIGKIDETEHKLVKIDKFVGSQYSKYTLTMHKGLHGNMTYVLYTDLNNEETMKKLVEICDGLKITQIIHILEEVIAYDLNK